MGWNHPSWERPPSGKMMRFHPARKSAVASSADLRLTRWRSMGIAARTSDHRCAFQRRSKKWSAAAATTVLCRTVGGSTDSSSPVSMWLAWLAT